MPLSWNEIRQNAIRFSREWSADGREVAEAKSFWDEDPINIKAVEILGNLHDAHAALARAVDRCYRSQPFTSERQRVEFLFALYQRFTAPLLPATETRRKRSMKA